jgi:hypothetical protein
MKNDVKGIIDKALEEKWFNTKSTGEILDFVVVEARKIHYKYNPIEKKSDIYHINKMVNYIMSEIYYKSIGIK